MEHHTRKTAMVLQDKQQAQAAMKHNNPFEPKDEADWMWLAAGPGLCFVFLSMHGVREGEEW